MINSQEKRELQRTYTVQAERDAKEILRLNDRMKQIEEDNRKKQSLFEEEQEKVKGGYSRDRCFILLFF